MPQAIEKPVIVRFIKLEIMLELRVMGGVLIFILHVHPTEKYAAISLPSKRNALFTVEVLSNPFVLIEMIPFSVRSSESNTCENALLTG